MVSIRRQVDGYGLEGKNSVYSLTGLLKDIREHRDLLTRESIFEVEDLEYDVESIRRAEEEYGRGQVEKGERGCHFPSSLNSQRLERRHQDVDHLAGVEPAARTPEDTIQDEVFTNLLAMLKDPCHKVKDHVDKFIAHAATPEDRAGVRADEAARTARGSRINICNWPGFRIAQMVTIPWATTT